MEILIMAGQLILGLSIIVGLHELGHLFAAKMFGMRVEKYFIGFPPKIWSIQRGETEYGIGAIPLGGFVKISGMIDESLDTEQINAEPQPWEFRAKPAWQRLVVMLGGIIVNVITGIIVFIAIAYNNGDKFLAREEVNKHGIVAGELAQEIGIRTGDKILKVNGKDFKDFSEAVGPDVFLQSNSYYTLGRNGQTVDVNVPNNFIEKLSEPDQRNNFILPAMPFKVGELVVGLPADKAGLKTGDRIASINGKPITYFHELQQSLDSLKGKPVALGVERGNEQRTINLTVSEEGTIGFYPQSLLNYTLVDYTLPEAVQVGATDAFGVVFNNIKGFGKIFRGEVSASKAISGPIGIARMFGGIWDWGRFLFLVGLLSMILAFTNALPIPALDGGHSVILLYEIVSGRKPSDRFLENAQKVGMVLLLGIMAFAIFNDVWKAMF
ncbi:RIP metalloprotease RseP [Rhabdobacter roseus]|uniref:Zinc metalloprotease n=1 Tax=Rhabdobacter roseus TaxID=1655419 RepID=A0A840TGE9_9BACT|nr:RIP metalloprotease RseP [Rhabdobacter roseus]MBB5282025.1 regulator of sigma E protease [Rhabdobacter roseus]